MSESQDGVKAFVPPEEMSAEQRFSLLSLNDMESELLALLSTLPHGRSMAVAITNIEQGFMLARRGVVHT